MQDDEELDELVRAAQTGKRAAMDEVLTRIRPLVMRRCARLLPYQLDAEEAAQDALLIISSKIGTFSGRGSFVGWVTIVTSNSARSTYRSMRRRAEASGVGEAPEAADPRTTSVIAGTRLDLLESLNELERRHPQLLEAFMMRDLGSLSYDQIAEATHAPLGTIKDRIHQARKFMRDRLQVQPDA